MPDPWLKPGILIGALMPIVWIGIRYGDRALGADPIKEIENELGLAALIFLIASVACSPAKRLWGWTWAMRVRRELGLLAFGYACIHFAVYFWDQFPDWGVIPEDILQRPFITVGFAAFVLLIPLALTSTKGSVKRLGFVRWQQIHWLVYPAGALAAVHFVWRVKRDVSQPLTYAIILALLLAIRLAWWLQKRYTRGQSLR
ncbi:MAG TPA: protein-methionine-sulfoxide reductase heme-binding subunit MsrQ [Chloroflexota bacterium]|nr:protein-methionine-sulfoxide reductase heme-binding subunit MsrQ [Chloroflexota bacterium]